MLPSMATKSQHTLEPAVVFDWCLVQDSHKNPRPSPAGPSIRRYCILCTPTRKKLRHQRRQLQPDDNIRRSAKHNYSPRRG